MIRWLGRSRSQKKKLVGQTTSRSCNSGSPRGHNQPRKLARWKVGRAKTSIFCPLPPQVSFFLLSRVFNCGRDSRPWPIQSTRLGSLGVIVCEALTDSATLKPALVINQPRKETNLGIYAISVRWEVAQLCDMHQVFLQQTLLAVCSTVLQPQHHVVGNMLGHRWDGTTRISK